MFALCAKVMYTAPARRSQVRLPRSPSCSRSPAVDDPLPFDGLAPSHKRCTMCKQWKPFDDFHRNRSRRDGRQRRCKECNIETNKRWYRDHPEARSARMDDYARHRRQASHRLVLEYLFTHPCVDCGESDPVVLEFDHLRDKVKNISAMANASQPWEKIEAEIAKCEVVCANCHRRRTAQRINSFRYRAGTTE